MHNVKMEVVNSYFLESGELSESLFKFLDDILVMSVHTVGKFLVDTLVVLN